MKSSSGLGKRPSGYQNRKLAAEKKENFEKLLSETHKINDFFRKNVTPSSENRDCDGQNSNVMNQEITNETSKNQNEKNEDQSSKNEVVPSLNSETEGNTKTENNETNNINFVLPDDPANWNINDLTRDYIAVHGITKQNFDDTNLAQSERKYGNVSRHLKKSILQRRLKNGETQICSFLIYSPSKKKLFCVPCLLFTQDHHSQFSNEGFDDWKNAASCVKDHENSPVHMQNVLALKQRGALFERVDDRLTMQLDKEAQYWRQVLHRVIAVPS